MHSHTLNFTGKFTGEFTGKYRGEQSNEATKNLVLVRFKGDREEMFNKHS